MIILIILLGGGYFVAKTVRHAMSPAPSPVVQQGAQPTTTSASPSGMQTQNTVVLTRSGWSPASLTIKAGDSVTWTNKSGQSATVSSDPHPTHTNYPPLNLGSFSDGSSVSLNFPKAGTYGYHNHLNPGETGTIIVQ